MLTRVYVFLLALAAVCLTFTATAHAAVAIDPPSGDGVGIEVFEAVYRAFQGGHYALALATALIITVALVRKYADVAFFHTDAGSALLVLSGSFGTALAASLVGGGPLTFEILKGAAVIAVSAAGGYGMIKRLIIIPLLAWPKLPPMLGKILGFLFIHEQNKSTDQSVPLA